MFPNLVFFGVSANFIGSLIYVKDTLYGITKPNRISWAIWGITAWIAFAASLAGGAGWAALPAFMSGFSSVMVIGASFYNPHAYWKIEKLDYICGIFSLLALLLWVITNEPLVAIIFAIISDILASIPTIIKAWKFPKSETTITYAGGGISAASGFFAVTQWKLSSYAFILYLTLINMTIILVCQRHNLFFFSKKKQEIIGDFSSISDTIGENSVV